MLLSEQLAALVPLALELEAREVTLVAENDALKAQIVALQSKWDALAAFIDAAYAIIHAVP